jgi:hypothetical protein
VTENLHKWIAALRSGKYKQGRRALRPSKNTYCCLGVACDLYGKENGVSWDENGRFMGKSGSLPSSVKKWLGISADQEDKLACLNDGCRFAPDSEKDPMSFDEIADYIEGIIERRKRRRGA